MTPEELKKLLNSSDALKRSEALEKLKETDFGVEMLPLLRKALDDDFISVVIHAADCIGKIGPQAYQPSSGQKELVCGVDKDHQDLAGQLMHTGGKMWGYSGYLNGYSACLDALVKIGFLNEFLVEHIHNHIGLTCPDDLLTSLEALQKIDSAEANDLIKRAANFWLPVLNKKYAKKVQAIVAKVDGLSEGGTKDSLKRSTGDWHHFADLEVTTGSLWVGDPLLANAEDGCVVKVPSGKYVVEIDAETPLKTNVAVSKLRVRMETAKAAKIGKKAGETGTDSAMMGVCDIKAFDAACGPDSGEEVQQAIETQTDKGFGIIKIKKFPGTAMPFVSTGSDGTGPVYTLVSGKQCVGIELSFDGED